MIFSEEMMKKVSDEESNSWWKAADRDVMHLFHQEHAAYDRKIVRFGFWIAVLTYIAFGVGDVYLFETVGPNMLLSRLLCGVFFLVVFEVAEYRNASLVRLHWIASLAIIIGSTSWLLTALGARNQLVLSQFMYFGTIFVLGANLYFNFKFSLSAFTSLTVTVVFVLASLFVLDIPLVSRVLLALFFVNVLVFSLYLSRRLSVERYNTFLHSLQAKFQERLAQERKEELKRIVEVDKLTGLKNRIAISREYVNLTRQRLSSSDQIGVFLVDVENLARLEQKLGKKIYDEVLIHIAQALKETAAAHDGIAGRFGPSEFIVLSTVSSDDHLQIIGQQISDCLKTVLAPGLVDGYEGLVFRVGVTATRNDANMDFTVILKEAERALFLARSEAGSAVKFYDPGMKIDEALNQSVVDLLNGQMQENSLQVTYTSIFDRRSEVVRAYDASISLIDAAGHVVCPEILSNAAGGGDELLQISQSAIERVCSDIVSLEQSAQVGLNLHPAYFRHSRFVETFKGVIHYYGVEASAIAFEIAEHPEILQETQVQKTLEGLSQMGVQFWLNHFGSINVGLDWVRRFEFDMVKVDPVLMQDVHVMKSAAFLEDLIRLLQNAGTKVLLTGIESEHQRDWAARSNADFVQGTALRLKETDDKQVVGSIH